MGLRAHVEGVLHPEGYHGPQPATAGRSGYFEGWYVKLVSADRARRFAVIPGVFLGPDGQGEAFVQLLDGIAGRSWYHRYELADFEAASDRYEIRVGPNTFTPQGVHLELPDGTLSGDAAFTSPLRPWPVTRTSPGVMGWYAWTPKMECKHGVVSLDHGLAGTLEHLGEPVDLAGGRGYLEKDWGAAFPVGYVWMQTNHFGSEGTCLTASTALIPWVTGTFRGHIVGLLHEGRLWRFTTYTGAQTQSLSIDDEHVRWTLRSRRGAVLDLVAERRGGALLHAPIRTEMHRRVEETLDARVHVRLTDADGGVVLDDTGECAGLEVHGDLLRLTTTRGR
jgi:hypothetical protein